MNKFKEWLSETNSITKNALGVNLDDLADYPIRDMFDDGKDPKSVALEVATNDSSLMIIVGKEKVQSLFDEKE